MSADTNSAAPSQTVPGSDNNTTVSGGSAANAQPNAQTQPNASRSQGTGYSAQAADAGTDERPGADGGRGAPRHDSTDDEMSADDLRAMVKALRAEAAAGRKAKQELDDFKRAQEDAKLSEVELLKKQYAEAQQQIEAMRLDRQEIALRARLDSTATLLGIKPELALRILDQKLVDFDDNGFPTNIRELLEQAMQDFGLAPSGPTAVAPASAAHPNTALAAAQPGRFAPPPPVPVTGATNPPRQGGIAAANGVFGPNERPRLNDRRLWSGPRRS